MKMFNYWYFSVLNKATYIIKNKNIRHATDDSEFWYFEEKL